MKVLFMVTVLLLATAIPTAIYAQDYNVHLKDRTLISGTYLGVSDGNMLYRTETFPLVLVPLSSIRAMYKGRTDVTNMLLSNQLLSDVQEKDIPSITPDSLIVTSFDAQQISALHYIHKSIKTASIPVWVLAILSITSTIIMLAQ